VRDSVATHTRSQADLSHVQLAYECAWIQSTEVLAKNLGGALGDLGGDRARTDLRAAGDMVLNEIRSSETRWRSAVHGGFTYTLDRDRGYMVSLYESALATRAAEAAAAAATTTTQMQDEDVPGAAAVTAAAAPGRAPKRR